MECIALEHSEIIFHENGILELRFHSDTDIKLSEVKRQEEIILSKLNDSQAGNSR